MSSVDDRIVNMKFNNKQFTQGVDKTKRDLTGLEKTIANTGKSKGLTSMAGAVQQVSTKFSAMQVAGTAALATIASKATTVGLNLLKSFTIDPIMDGFKEYQTGLNSIQTIMSNTGKSVKVVNSALDQLNEYSDQTIYNFSEMAKNVGTFTAAGVDLKTSVASIKGIANLAALSGSNSQQAATAMYQLSQAISAGKVGLQDWNSVVNAGMGGKIFQTALARTAQNMGDLSKNAVALEGPLKKLTINGESFRQSISAAPGSTPWLTGENLVETLKQISGGYTVAELRAKGYSKAQAAEIDKLAKTAFDAATQIKTLPQLIGVVRESIGSTFATAFRTIVGDFEQSKALWGAVGYSIIGPHGWLTRIQEGLTDTLESWADGRGREKVLKGFKRMFAGLTAVVGAFTGAFTDIFPPATGETLVNLSSAFKRFALNLRPSKDTVEDLRNIFKGFFSVIHVGWSILKGVVGAFSSFFGALFASSEGARGGLLSFAGTIGKVITAFDQWITSGGKIESFFSGIGSIVGTFLSPIVATVGLVIDAFAALASGKGIGAAMESFDAAKAIFGGFISDIITGLDQLTAPFDGLKSKIADFARVALGPFQIFVDAFERARTQIVQGLGLENVLPTMDGLQTVFQRAKDKIVDFVTGFSLASVPLEDFGDAIDYVVEKVTTLVSKLDISGKLESIKKSVSGLFDSLSSSGGGAAASGTTAMVASASATGDAFSSLGDIMSKVGDAIKTVFSAVADAASFIGGALAGAFPSDPLEWATLLNVLISGALIKRLFFSKGLFETLGETIEGVGGSIVESFGELTSTLKTLQTSIKAEMLRNIAIAVALLVGSLFVLSHIPMDKLKVGLGALAATFGLLSVALLALSKIDASMKISVVAAGLILIAGAIAILTVAIAVLGALPFDVLKQGLGAIAIVLAMLTTTLMVLSKGSAKVISAAASMVLMATAINIIVAAVVALGLLPLDTLKQGLGGIAAGLGILTVALLMLSGNSVKILAAGAAMVLMATALDIIVVSITALGLLPWDVVEQGLKAVAIGMGIMVVALLLLGSMSAGVLAGGAAMLLLATSLNILVGVILLLGAAPWSVVEQGLVAMGAGLIILLIAAAGAMAVAPGLAALSTTFLALGAAALMAGTGMFLFGAGIALIAATGAAAIAIITIAIHAFIALLPSIALQVAAAFVTFVQAIALAAPKIRRAMSTIFKEMIGVVTDGIPEIGKLFDQIVATAITSLENGIPRFIEMGFTIVDEFLKSADAHIPSIVDSAVSLVTNFTEELGRRSGELADAGLNLVVDIMDGITDAIENSDKVRSAARRMASTFVDELKETLAGLIPNISLPDIPMPNLPPMLKKLLGGGFTAGANTAGYKGGVDPFSIALENTARTVSTAIEGSIRLLVGAVSGATYELAKTGAALKKQARYDAVIAESRSASADTAVTSADESLANARDKKTTAKDIKNKAKRTKAVKKANEQIKKAEKQKKAAAKQRQDANAAEAKAALSQLESDYQNQKALDAITYKDDQAGLGDAKSQQGQDLANRSQELLASAQAKADEIKRLEELAKNGGKNAKAYRDQAAQLRKEAAQETAESMALATQSIEAQAAAVAAYAAARKSAALDAIQQLADIKKKQDADQKAREWEAKFDEADNATKISMLDERARLNESNAQLARAEMQNAFAEADALQAEINRTGTATEAQLASIQLAAQNAATWSDEAAAAADAAEADRQQIEQLQQQSAQQNSSGGATGGAVIAPSRTALEDAALAVDRYTSSVAQAEEMATSSSSTTQFVQNNYSPEALSASEIYRQSRNLISTVEVKMGANN